MPCSWNTRWWRAASSASTCRPPAHLGLGITPWSPLAAGFLAGKYERAGAGGKPAGEGRLSGPNPFGDAEVHGAQLARARTPCGRWRPQLGRPLAQVALAWVAAQPGITAPIIGASSVAQLRDNFAALDVRFSPEQLRTLDEASILKTPSTTGMWTLHEGQPYSVQKRRAGLALGVAGAVRATFCAVQNAGLYTLGRWDGGRTFVKVKQSYCSR
ncbi:MAG: aldo/keto reductase [Hymenobacter sp.]